MKKALVAGLLFTLSVFSVSTPGAAAAPVEGGEASAYGLTALIAANELIPPTPTAEVSGIGDEVDEVAIPIEGDPLLVNGTLIARAAVHEASDIPSALEQEPSAQDVAGPYNAQGVGQIEDLEVLIDAVATDVPLIEADLIRGEAVAVCNDGTVEYSASSEVVNLVLGGEDPFSGPLNDALTQITEGLEPLADLVDVDLNVVDVTDEGATVDAVVITVLAAAGDPLVEIRLGHAEVSGVTCAGDLPECSDNADNDGDGRIDAEDPGCWTDVGDPDSYDPNDDSEAGEPQCVDGIDNEDAEDTLADAEDPGCHTDRDATNPSSYDPRDDNEADDQVGAGGAAPGAAPLPRTGMPIATGLAAALGAGALGLLALRRRSVV